MLVRHETDPEDLKFSRLLNELFRQEADQTASALRRADENLSLAAAVLEKMKSERERWASRGPAFTDAQDYRQWLGEQIAVQQGTRLLLLMQSTNLLQSEMEETRLNLARAQTDTTLLEDSLRMDFIYEEKARTRLDIVAYRQQINRLLARQKECQQEAELVEQELATLRQALADRNRAWQQQSATPAFGGRKQPLLSILKLLEQSLASTLAAQRRISLSVLTEEIASLSSQIQVKQGELAGWRDLEENDRLKGVISPLTTESILNREKALSSLTERLADLRTEQEELLAGN